MPTLRDALRVRLLPRSGTAGCSVSHPNYRQTTIYIDKVLHRQLLRSLEESDFEGDFSEWVEQKMKGEIESREERDS